MERVIPRWGIVTAAPHEYLIHLRRGRVVRAEQGGSCFRWPTDTVALVDTSVRRLQFTADQVTREKTGVQVTGLAVFRIVRPELAYRMLDLDDPGAYTETLRQMFVGATRRLVANLSLEECLTKRKAALAEELMAEVAPVVQGRGAPEDDTERGWGVCLDTIEVQDVRVLSEEVFKRLQAPYREELALEALKARAEVDRESARIAAEQQRSAEKTRKELMELEEARLAAQRVREEEDLAHGAQLKRSEQEAKLAREAARHTQQIEVSLRAAEAKRSRGEADAQSEVGIAELEAQALRLRRTAQAEMEQLERASRDHVSEARLRELMVTDTLPEVARAFRDSFDQVVVSSTDLSFLSGAVAEVLATARAVGVQLPSPEG